jgi:damage-control phosphatase, subfamily I
MVCFVRQTLEAVRMMTDDESLQERILRQVMAESADFNMTMPAPVMAQRIHRIIRQGLNNADPYVDAKKRFNQFALGMKNILAEKVRTSPSPIATAVKLAIAGNIIDFGIHSDLDEVQVQRCIADALEVSLDRSILDQFIREASNAKEILYLADNAGEIVLDQLLIELLGPSKITVAVKGGPIINDATLIDAEMTGLTKLVRVISNGIDAPGTLLDQCSPEFLELFRRADMIISKGQGNYETLSETNRSIWFLLKVKCSVVSRHLNLPQDTLALIKK